MTTAPRVRFAHFYQCRSCRTVLATLYKAYADDPYRCIRPNGNGHCRAFLRFLYTDTVTDPRLAELLATNRVVWNPGLQLDAKEKSS